MSEKEKAIGVFDSGLGGISVLQELRKTMPQEHYIYYGDSAFAPYGEKSREAITERCKSICDELIQRGVKAIVIACNTATSACVQELRLRYPQLPIIGMEPALKPAVDHLTQQKVIVMATHFTLKEKKFEQLLSRYSEDHTIYRMPTPKLVELVEAGELEDDAKVTSVLRDYFAPYDMSTIDSIVLGCTHFVFFREQIYRIIQEDTRIVDGNAGTARHVMDLLKERHTLREDGTSKVTLLNSSADESYLERSRKLLAYKV